MIYLLLMVSVVALIALYKFLPNRKLFMYFCVTLLTVFCASAFIQGLRSQQEVITRAEIEQIREQQQIFIEWYAAYQKDIEHLDRNWQLYHSIVESLKTAEIYEYSTYEQLVDLEIDAINEQNHIHELKVPAGLDEECSAAVRKIIRKTQNYVDAQTKVISAVLIAANPDAMIDLHALNWQIKDITIRESPAGLFTASEVAAIRDKLTIPGEDN